MCGRPHPRSGHRQRGEGRAQACSAGRRDDGSVTIAPATAEALARVTDQFSASLHAHRAAPALTD
ncbi:hypothetical protein ACFY91_14845 [Streptomyces albogriseolus]|uniref:hypothetical protein n=1 Tax=Streptomyces albogriseolus TaxID=1887 RepID=UPI0036E7B883